jgi:hypothetical protein
MKLLPNMTAAFLAATPSQPITVIGGSPFLSQPRSSRKDADDDDGGFVPNSPEKRGIHVAPTSGAAARGRNLCLNERQVLPNG